jgi:hypothetical protein
MHMCHLVLRWVVCTAQAMKASASSSFITMLLSGTPCRMAIVTALYNLGLKRYGTPHRMLGLRQESAGSTMNQLAKQSLEQVS